MTDALSALDAIAADIAALSEVLSTTRTKFVPSNLTQPLARSIATAYFTLIREDLGACKTRTGLVDEIDHVIQVLLELATNRREKAAYAGQLNEVRPLLLEASIDLLKSQASPRLILSATERSILETLRKLLPATGLSYEQTLRDIAQGGRVSWRGTGAELREILREVIDHLAPDEQVMDVAGFQLERDQKGPTQKQKARYILRARKSRSSAVEVVESSLRTVEEAVAALARATYQRGSASTHAGTDGVEVRNLKRYVDAVLGELLEVT